MLKKSSSRSTTTTKKLTLDGLSETETQSALEEAEELEHEPKERAMTGLECSGVESLAGIMVFKNTGLNEQRAVTTRQEL
jgi:hypothetical protein